MGLLLGLLAVFNVGCSPQHELDINVNNEVNNLLVGMCFDDPSEEDLIIDDQRNTAADNFPIVDCHRFHDNEIYYIFNLPDAEKYNETEALLNSMLDVCEDKYKKYIGVAYKKSFYEMSVLTPTETSWKDGDREVVCYAFHPNGKKIDFPLKDIHQ
ncbi:septum formation family protein [Psychrobacter lutiphocae]|uniref:septum formation family protein n=1 Tax=Psychrobacter lutiphocae TaxID=540500 RepID=UPI0003A3BC0B|nr:septum formation family protein [Psychrobacter lutiphocae]